MGGREGVLDLFSVSIVVAFFCCTVLWNLLLAGVYMGVSVLNGPKHVVVRYIVHIVHKNCAMF